MNLMRRPWFVRITVAVTIALILWLVLTAFGAIADRQRYEEEGRSVRDQLVTVASNVEDQSTTLLECTTAGPLPPPDTGHACYDRGVKATAAAIGQLQRSIDCVAWYSLGERPPACADVTARMDAIGRGVDPFAPTAPPRSQEDQ